MANPSCIMEGRVPNEYGKLTDAMVSAFQLQALKQPTMNLRARTICADSRVLAARLLARFPIQSICEQSAIGFSRSGEPAKLLVTLFERTVIPATHLHLAR